MKIGELAQATGTPAQTIRYYEREGLLPEPPRSDSNYRRYGPAHVQRLALIRRCRALDMELAEIRALLALHDDPLPACDAVNDLIDAHIGHVAKRIAELQALRKTLVQLRARCAQPGDTENCGVMQGLGEVGTRPVSRRRGL